ncbi:hypothetical protein [Stackebrandtia nassauensis]|uniref:Uncharacterized protein n=1 Tax=Stackebrandtia nassauensis (strain DSM 44728 / CIP 108903 / NRRL B-16338 / NBRC 102104 / LLR-40K-21) TaxID=446470 RepID=D3Q1V8_STANL|nr:hypothetical protein [Stackebrandtia nassauensis]ADD41825.1 hypothetical protein Snas_2131 [Stackebrandtia nassauensis DSM 44728]
MSDFGYAQSLHELRQLRDGDLAANTTARSQVEQATAKVARLRETLEHTQAQILAAANRFKTTVPDLRPESTDPAATRPATDLSAELAAGAAKAQLADKHVQRSIREGQLAPLLPGAPAFVRNLVVYGAAMIACYLIQSFLALFATDELALWLVFMPPVIALVAGYVGTGLAGTPRLPIYDDRGNTVEFVVKKSPRLGAALAVITIVAFFFTTAP